LPIFRLRAGTLERGRDDRLDVPPDLHRVVLDPTGSRADLRVLALRDGNDAAGAVEQDETGAGRPLIDGTDVRSHEPTQSNDEAVQYDRTGLIRQPSLRSRLDRKRAKGSKPWKRRRGRKRRGRLGAYRSSLGRPAGVRPRS